MKRVGNIWQEAVNLENGIIAVIDGTRNKRGDREVQCLLYDDKEHWHQIDPDKAREYIEPVCAELSAKEWRHSPPRYKKQFCKNRASNKGKWRDLYIPTLKDHIVAHMIMQASMDAFTRGMHPNCCGSVPGRGIKHILWCVKRWFQDDPQCRYFVKLDIRKFFDSIDADILKAVFRTKIKDPFILWALDQIVDSAPVACPVGYYTSPWFANLYLEKMDWHIVQDLYKERRGKRIPYVRHYLRYADDMLLVGTSKSDLKKAVHDIIEYLGIHYHLKIKPEWEIKQIGKHELIDGEWKLKPGTYWCDIGGYKFCKDATIMRDGVFLSSRRLAKKIYKQGYATEHQAKGMMSKIGWAKHCDSYHFMENDIRPYINIKQTRRMIGDVDKKRKRRTNQTTADRGKRKQCDPEKELHQSCGNRGNA